MSRSPSPKPELDTEQQPINSATLTAEETESDPVEQLKKAVKAGDREETERLWEAGVDFKAVFISRSSTFKKLLETFGKKIPPNESEKVNSIPLHAIITAASELTPTTLKIAHVCSSALAIMADHLLRKYLISNIKNQNKRATDNLKALISNCFKTGRSLAYEFYNENISNDPDLVISMLELFSINDLDSILEDVLELNEPIASYIADRVLSDTAAQNPSSTDDFPIAIFTSVIRPFSDRFLNNVTFVRTLLEKQPELAVLSNFVDNMPLLTLTCSQSTFRIIKCVIESGGEIDQKVEGSYAIDSIIKNDGFHLKDMMQPRFHAACTEPPFELENAYEIITLLTVKDGQRLVDIESKRINHRIKPQTLKTDESDDSSDYYDNSSATDSGKNSNADSQTCEVSLLGYWMAKSKNHDFQLLLIKALCQQLRDVLKIDLDTHEVCDGKNALMLAIELKNLELVSLLRDMGVRPCTLSGDPIRIRRDMNLCRKVANKFSKYLREWEGSLGQNQQIIALQAALAKQKSGVAELRALLVTGLNNQQRMESTLNNFVKYVGTRLLEIKNNPAVTQQLDDLMDRVKELENTEAGECDTPNRSSSAGSFFN
jgi:hypothetical protein